MLIVIALGGNALLRRGEPMDQAAQERNVRTAVQSIAGLNEGHRLVVTHGNGPQVGLLALAQESYAGVRPYTLDVLGSETQGMIGYLLEEAFRAQVPGKDVATLLTQVLVDGADPAFANPTKPIGPVYSAAQAQELNASQGWRMAQDGDGYRRVVASPEPLRILELNAIRLLSAHNVLVICAGGGGVPVVTGTAGACYGVEAVVDKDLTAALLACELDADMLVLLTDVDAVELDWRTPHARKIRAASTSAMRAQRFAAGSMAPKVEAACRFAAATGRTAAIGTLDQAIAIARGTAGTSIVDSSTPTMSFWD